MPRVLYSLIVPGTPTHYTPIPTLCFCMYDLQEPILRNKMTDHWEGNIDSRLQKYIKTRELLALATKIEISRFNILNYLVQEQENI